jgi:hypothetical protein
MEQTRSEVTGLKKFLMGLFDFLYFRIPLLSEVFNQVADKNRALLLAWHFLRNNEVRGDYYEFGVFRGETFRNSMRAYRRIFGRPGGDETYFHAFDSFAGLPEVSSMKNSSVVWKAGEFSASEKVFRHHVRHFEGDFKIEVTPGFFNDSLRPERIQAGKYRPAAFVLVDCDLYESTVPVLQFIEPYLQTGTILFFDDWFSCRGDQNEGEPKASREWLNANPHIELVDYRNVAVAGKIFIVNRRNR